MDLLNNMLSGVPSCMQSSSSTLGGILSGPCALFLFNLLSLSVIDAGIIGISAIPTSQ